jgi:hypothetical protein
MLMVVFGAGASYDSSPDFPVSNTHKLRPPLADTLFVNREEFRDARGQFPEFHEIIPELLPGRGRPLEESLQRLEAEGATNPQRRQQLTAVRYYLQSIFRNLVPQWLTATGGVTNYLALLGQINHHRKGDEPVCLVTFNYDTLLEAALARYGMRFEVPNDYISSNDFKLFKLHGSENWGRCLNAAPSQVVAGKRTTDPWAKPHEMIEHVESLNISDQFVVTGVGVPHTGPPLYPAIAIPVLNKNVFECPPAHIGTLTHLIPRVTKVLTIGWRANEEHFLQLLRKLPSVSIVTVAGEPPDAEEILNKIRALGMPVQDADFFASFSDTIAERRLDPLLAS